MMTSRLRHPKQPTNPHERTHDIKSFLLISRTFASVTATMNISTTEKPPAIVHPVFHGHNNSTTNGTSSNDNDGNNNNIASSSSINTSNVFMQNPRKQRTKKISTKQDETTTKKNTKQIPEWRNAVAGACAGAVAKTTVAPIERVKLLLQLQGSAEGVTGRSSWRVAWDVYQAEGMLAFWRGNVPNVIRTAGQSAVNFAFMDYYKSVSTPVLDQYTKSVRGLSKKEQKRRKKLLVSFVSGGLAGATGTTLLYPMEFLRTRLAMDQGRSMDARQFTGMGDVLTKTLKTDGIRGPYQGYGIALAGSAMYRLLCLGGYDAVKGEVLEFKSRRAGGNDTTHLSMTERLVLAQAVALTAGTVCYPIDSVRRRLMMQAGKPEHLRLYQGSIHCFRLVLAQEGVRGFFLGLAPNLVRSMGAALMLVAYDAIKPML